MNVSIKSLLFALCFVVGGSANRGEQSQQVSNLWAVKVAENVKVDELALKFGFRNRGEIIPASNIFEFVKPDLPKSKVFERTKNDLFDFGLSTHPNVIEVTRQMLHDVEAKAIFARPQSALFRRKREALEDAIQYKDPLWPETWHLHARSPTNPGMNVDEAWKAGITGKGVTVVHVDSGIDQSHSDLWLAYAPKVSLDLVDDDDDPNFAVEGLDSDKTSHGTNMAGLVAAAANNSVCSVGIAHEASLGMIRLVGGPSGSTSDSIDAKSLSHRNADVDVFVVGFGPNDRANVVRGSGPLETAAIKRAAEEFDNVIAYPSGNGGRFSDSCAFDGRANDIHTLAFNAVGESGSMPKYTENCTAVLASAYGSGQYPEGYMVTLEPGGGCTNAFTGTSSSSAVAGGVMALIKQANPRLGWRDVQHVVIRGTRPHTELTQDVEWLRNGDGRWFSPSFGYGLLDVAKLVHVAKRWRNVGEQRQCLIIGTTRENIVRPNATFTSSLTINDADCQDLNYLEHVQVTFSASARKRGDIELSLISPSGTRSVIVPTRKLDFSPEGFHDWTILCLQLWGENAHGKWQLLVTNKGKASSRLTKPIRFQSWSLKLYGTTDKPDND